MINLLNNKKYTSYYNTIVYLLHVQIFVNVTTFKYISFKECHQKGNYPVAVENTVNTVGAINKAAILFAELTDTK